MMMVVIVSTGDVDEVADTTVVTLEVDTTVFTVVPLVLVMLVAVVSISDVDEVAGITVVVTLEFDTTVFTAVPSLTEV